MRALLLAALIAVPCLAQPAPAADAPAPAEAAPPVDAAPAGDAPPPAEGATPDSAATRPTVVIVREQPGCADWDAAGMPEGPVMLGYAEADMTTARRACPRTEVGLATRLGAIIDTPNFYGNIGVTAVVFGSLALSDKAELYATLEAVDFEYVQTAFKATSLSLGNLTVGATRVLYGPGNFVGAVSGRILLPTASGIPGARPLGAEVGHASTWRAHRLLEVHSWLGVDASVGLSAASPFPRFGGSVSAGAQFTPLSWLSVVLDLSGRLGAVTWFAPSLGLRFRVSSLGIELGGTLPVAGTDRHDFIGGARFTWRI